MTADPVPVEAPHIRDAKRAGTKVSAISLTVIWVLVAVWLIVPAINAQSHGRTVGAFFWIGVVALVILAFGIIRVWRRLSTRYPKL